MKNAILLNSLKKGGAEKVALLLLQKFMEKGEQFILVCLEKSIYESYEVSNDIKVIYLSNNDETTNFIKKLFYFVIYIKKLKKIVEQERLSFIQSHTFRSNYINILTRLFGGRQKVQLVNHTSYLRYQKRGLIGKSNIAFIKWIYSLAPEITFISKRMASDFRQVLPVKVKFHVINNPYDIDEMCRLADERGIKNETFSPQPDKKYIVYAGRLIKLKRVSDIIEAFRNFKGRQDYDLLILGEGEERNKLIQLSENWGLSEKIHFLGNVGNPYFYLKQAEIAVLASDWEGFPNVLIESLACQCAVVASDCISGPREILNPGSDVFKILQFNDPMELGEYGILFPVGNVAALTEAINILTSEIDILRSFQCKALARAKDFSVNIIFEKYYEIFRQSLDIA